MKVTRRQREVLADLEKAGGEALRNGAYFQIGELSCGADVKLMERLESVGCVRLDRVGESVFALITEKGRAALARS